MFNKFLSKNRTFYEITWKKYYSTMQATEGKIMLRKHIACWVNKSTDTHTHNK